MIFCDLCNQECHNIYVHESAPDIILCYKCSTLSAASVVRHFIAPTWPRCEICKNVYRTRHCSCIEKKEQN